MHYLVVMGPDGLTADIQCLQDAIVAELPNDARIIFFVDDGTNQLEMGKEDLMTGLNWALLKEGYEDDEEEYDIDDQVVELLKRIDAGHERRKSLSASYGKGRKDLHRAGKKSRARTRRSVARQKRRASLSSPDDRRADLCLLAGRDVDDEGDEDDEELEPPNAQGQNLKPAGWSTFRRCGRNVGRSLKRWARADVASHRAACTLAKARTFVGTVNREAPSPSAVWVSAPR